MIDWSNVNNIYLKKENYLKNIICRYKVRIIRT